jgi:hypothetical protein
MSDTTARMIYMIKTALEKGSGVVVATVTDGGRCAAMITANEIPPRGHLTLASLLIGRAKDALDEQVAPFTPQDRHIHAFVQAVSAEIESLENDLEDIEQECEQAALTEAEGAEVEAVQP